MNRQANYSITAFLLLLLFTGLYYLLTLFSFGQTDKQTIEYSIPKSSISISLSDNAAKGKTLFMSRCASCHQLLKNATGPGLADFENRGPWADRKNLYDWIKNPSEFMGRNKYVQDLKEAYGSMMTAFPDLTNEEIDSIVEFINQSDKSNRLIAQK